jgi:hypothetical protein
VYPRPGPARRAESRAGAGAFSDPSLVKLGQLVYAG